MINLDKLVIGTYEVNWQFPGLSDYLGNSTTKGINWMDTAITYDNDYFIKDWKGGLISKISPFMTDEYDFWIENHLKNLNRVFIEIMLVHNTRHPSWIDLYGKLIHDNRFHRVGISNANIDQLKKIKEVYGHYPSIIETEINPGYLDMDLISFCKDNNIEVIAYAIFGGKYNAKRYIQHYTMEGIFKVLDQLADKIIIRWDSKFQFKEILDAYLSSSWIKLDGYNIWVGNRDKSIVPEVYSYPGVIKVDSNGFPLYYSGFDITEIIPKDNFEFHREKFTEISYPKLEFITEYMAKSRYLGLNNRVAIIDKYGYPSKVNNEGSKVYIK